MKYFLMTASAFALIACDNADLASTTSPAETEVVETVEVDIVSAEDTLDAVLAEQSDETKARYDQRHPKETLMFFGVEPGMTVVDSLAGQVWYAGILSDYLGADGAVIGADYSMDMWPLFGGFATEEWIENRRNWKTDFVNGVDENRGEGDAPVSAFNFGSLPEEKHGSADVVMMVRAAHHFNRFEDDGGFFTEALTDAMNVLKPGGTLGVVQHRAPEGHADEWATGDNGYVKQSRIISFIESAGFELVEASEVNANPQDQPSEEDIVWRLPPTLATSEEGSELRTQLEAIGESDRMTLKFRKPE